MVNPQSTQPSSAFKIDIYDSSNNLLEFLHSGPSLQATIPSSLSMTVTPSSLQNNALNTYTLTYSTSFPIASTVALILVVPKEQSCPSCVSQGYNNSHNEIIFYNQVMNNNSITVSLASFVNYYSYEPQNILGAITSNDLLYLHANGSATITTSSPSSLAFSHSFSTY